MDAVEMGRNTQELLRMRTKQELTKCTFNRT